MSGKGDVATLQGAGGSGGDGGGGGINGVVLVVIETLFLSSGESGGGGVDGAVEASFLYHRGIVLVVCIVEALFLLSLRHRSYHLRAGLVPGPAVFAHWPSSPLPWIQASPRLPVHLQFDSPLLPGLYRSLIHPSAAAVAIILVLVVVPSPTRCCQPVEG
ncbi:hypothetical protein IW261DRAFT_1424423 [Armillaria novae-zelandiae]|uniref:Uncharacterized protein n=1 Tax=Armillaria novae-zelandiae TaxID=153914 RepID=A0AA39NV23_9AGAR|nr:hypothetical protein IW261DRAFT_1424423 [Armillaria novae-zelandiae]